MIEVKNLTKLYGPRAAIHELDFSVEKGEVVGFLGPNGAGKSTTMKILTGFLSATHGSAKLGGHDVFDEPLEVKRLTGYLPENPPVYLDMVVEDYLSYAAKIQGVSSSDISKAVATVVEQCVLGEVRNRIIGNLSKGFRQRIGLAQALVHNPPILILDEPTVGLDPAQIVEIRDLIKGLRGNHTVILSSHILPEVTATCQRIIVINRGKIVAKDTIENLTGQMHAGALYNLMVSKASDQGVEALNSVSGVRKAELQNGCIRLELDSAEPMILENIVETAVHQKMGVHSFFAETKSLEKVFLELTTKE